MASANQSRNSGSAILWIVPWPSLIVAVSFVLWMWLASDPMIGLFLAWVVVICASPLAILFSVVGVGSGAMTAAFIVLGLTVLMPGVLFIGVGWKIRSVALWSAGLNTLVLSLGFAGGVYASIVRFSDSWPY